MLLPSDPARAFMPYPPAPVPHAGQGPLAGLTLAVKDLFDVAGYPTSAGSPHMLALSGLKSRTAPTVQRLLDAGARFVGKAITDELAFSLSGRNAHFGTPLNGGAPERIPGGSSSGSASAVSNGLADLALGTDTGGSVRGPASHCGLLGLRPTHGRVSLEGCHDLAPSFDTCGFFARDASVFLKTAEVLLGEDTRELSGQPRAAMAADAFVLLSDEVRESFLPVLRKVEALLGEARAVAVAENGFEPLYWAFRRMQSREAWRVNGAFIERYRPPLGPGVAERFAYSRDITDAEVTESETVRSRARQHLCALVEGGTVLVLPTMPDIAPLLTDDEAALGAYREAALKLLCLSGLAGLPQVTLPLATRAGAPLGLSLIGPEGSDLSLVRLATRLMP